MNEVTRCRQCQQIRIFPPSQQLSKNVCRAYIAGKILCGAIFFSADLYHEESALLLVQCFQIHAFVATEPGYLSGIKSRPYMAPFNLISSQKRTLAVGHPDSPSPQETAFAFAKAFFPSLRCNAHSEKATSLPLLSPSFLLSFLLPLQSVVGCNFILLPKSQKSCRGIETACPPPARPPGAPDCGFCSGVKCVLCSTIL
jgi:hypothetical protein